MRSLRFFPRVVGAMGLLLFSLAGSGCATSMLANKIIQAPNHQPIPETLKKITSALGAQGDFYSLNTKVHVEPHPADLAVAVLEPGDYQLKHSFKLTGQSADPTEEEFSMEFHLGFAVRDKVATHVTPKGTIVLLHGVMMNKESMLHWAIYLAQKGYRIVLVDLRGHGESTGRVISYGAFETADLTQVLDELSRRKLIAGRVGVLGLSYGGAIAIDWAARDPRIEAVVALAPFSDARRAIDQFAHALFPEMMKHVSAETLSAAFTLAAQRGGFTWEQTDVRAAAQELRHPILLIHGTKDTWVPPANSEQLKLAAPDGSRRLLGPGNHLTLSLRLEPIASNVAQWFDRALVAP